MPEKEKNPGSGELRMFINARGGGKNGPMVIERVQQQWNLAGHFCGLLLVML
jgi:hypothetical protein